MWKKLLENLLLWIKILWIQFNPNTGKWFWKESSDFTPRNMYVLIVEYVEL